MTRTRILRQALWLPLLLLTPACGEFDPEIGPDQVITQPQRVDPGNITCGVEDSDPSTDVTFTDVRREVFAAECGCHTEPNGLGRLLGGLDLDDLDAIKAGGFTAGDQVVVPGNPCASQLLLKLQDDPPFGSRMPRGGPPLETNLRVLLTDWIVEGAR
jgi:hypothetical protein